MKSLLKQMTKEDLIDLIADNTFMIEPFELYRKLHSKIMDKFDKHIEKGCPKIGEKFENYEDYLKYSKQGEAIEKQFDSLDKKYNKIIKRVQK